MSSSISGDGREQRDVEVTADDRCEGEHPIGVRSEARQASSDDLLDADGQPHRPQVDVGHPPAPSSWKMVPVSARWRRISPTKNGFPAVSASTASRTANPSSVIS